ncbi:hypothetical protein BDV93DRAFT_14301 [Ceratobasidium sp. AG-I]|nr:hypothetical protein BDV93DRAFT_14301 [Ceratobasidium sp. AG-I]
MVTQRASSSLQALPTSPAAPLLQPCAQFAHDCPRKARRCRPGSLSDTPNPPTQPRGRIQPPHDQKSCRNYWGRGDGSRA